MSGNCCAERTADEEAELLRPLLLEEIDIASEPEDEKILELIDRLILEEEVTRKLPVSRKTEVRRELFYSVRRLDVLQGTAG